MSDLIERQAAIKAAQFYETFYDPFPRVIESINAIEPVEVNKWIPVTDRLPEEDGEYLVTVKSDYMHYTTKAWFFVKYKIWNKQYDEGGYEARITAWMPTPEPYREEDGS